MPLKNRNGTIVPGGYPFTDPRTGYSFDAFTGGTFAGSVRQIIKHRLANPKIYDPVKDASSLSVDGVSKQLSDYTCARLGNSDEWCVDGVKIPAKVYQPPTYGKACKFCGSTDFVPVYCSSCGGNKLRGFKCAKCGKEAK